MIEPDEELRKILRQWEAPAPGPGLDARVWSDVRRRRSGRTWVSVAAGLALAVSIFTLWLAVPASTQSADPSVKTTADAPGFRPLANGAITIVRAGMKQ